MGKKPQPYFGFIAGCFAPSTQIVSEMTSTVCQVRR